MFKAIKAIIDHISSHVTVWTWVWGGGVVSAAAVSALLARVTDWIAPWGPIGWWAAALLGALAASILFVVSAFGYSLMINSQLKKKVYSTHDRINPVEKIFEKKRIFISDLALPYDPIIRRKTFRDCELIGPCNVIILGNTEIAHNDVSIVQAALVKKDIPIVNAIAFQDCSIRNCRLYQITFLIPDQGYRQFSDGMRGLEWITYTPI